MQAELQQLSDSIGKVIVGKDDVIRNVLAGLLCGGHILIEDVPGVGKTQLAAALAKSVGGSLPQSINKKFSILHFQFSIQVLPVV